MDPTEFMRGMSLYVGAKPLKRDLSPKADKPPKTRKITVKSHTRTILCKK